MINNNAAVIPAFYLYIEKAGVFFTRPEAVKRTSLQMLSPSGRWHRPPLPAPFFFIPVSLYFFALFVYGRRGYFFRHEK